MTPAVIYTQEWLSYQFLLIKNALQTYFQLIYVC